MRDAIAFQVVNEWIEITIMEVRHRLIGNCFEGRFGALFGEHFGDALDHRHSLASGDELAARGKRSLGQQRDGSQRGKNTSHGGLRD